MTKIIALVVLHGICLYFLQLLWKDKNKALERGNVMTRMGIVTKRKSPRLFYFSIWVDFVILSALYVALIVYSFVLLSR
jgi:hypothetical protein